MKTTKQKAVEHYERMIEWAKKSEYEDSELMIYKMLVDIKETTGSEDCSYCKKYDFKNNYTDACFKCELNNNNLDYGCCNGLYIKMVQSKTRKTWIRYAKKVKQYIIDNG